MLNQKLIVNAIIAAVVWGLTYLYIRRYLNPENKYNVDKFRLDAIYGGIAAGCAVILKEFIQLYMVNRL
jgi:hypothetical protein